MKNLLYFLVVTFFFASCSNDQEYSQEILGSKPVMDLQEGSSLSNTSIQPDVANRTQIVTSVEEVIALRLDEQFDLSQVAYDEFIGSLVFENEQFLGAIYEGVESEMDDIQSDQFWSNFGFSLRQNQSDLPIYYGWKPKRGGCKSNPRWICVIKP